MSEAKAMSAAMRAGIYRRFNRGRAMTPKQRRRLQHKVNHATAPFGKKAES